MDKIEYTNTSNKKRSGVGKIILTIIISFALGFGLMYYYSSKNPNIVTKSKTVSETKVTEESMEDAIAKVYDSVLCIEILDENGNTLSSGTGFVYAKDNKYGYVLTNAHVVSSGSIVKGLLSNDNSVDLKILGTDTYTDLAVLQMDVKSVLQVASIGKSSNIKVGNTVFTVGSPMGSSYAGTVTKGILSGKDRLIETSTSTYNSATKEDYIVKVLQTDAAISPGNSGGPLVDLAGDVIGINSLKLVDEQVEGMGFAIPIEDAMNYVNILEKGEKIQRPIVGVQLIDMTNEFVLYRYGVSNDLGVKEGIVLMKISDGYPAAKAGLKENDVITKVDGKKVKTVSEFKYELYKHSIGDEIEITYYRNKKEKTTKMKLDKAN